MRSIKSLVFLSIVFSLLLPAAASAKQKEKYYQIKWCDNRGGQTEVQLPDRTRVDCLTKTHAVEVDFGKKWYQAIGQSLYYSLKTGKKAGIVLIVREPKERKYWIRLNSVIEHYGLPIVAWMVDK